MCRKISGKTSAGNFDTRMLRLEIADLELGRERHGLVGLPGRELRRCSDDLQVLAMRSLRASSSRRVAVRTTTITCVSGGCTSRRSHGLLVEGGLLVVRYVLIVLLAAR